MQKYNLVDEKWIPIIGKGNVSLIDIFSDPTLDNLSGSPIEKISILKFLLAIVQAACTPENDEEWENLQNVIQVKCQKYLNRNRENFWLYHDENPFLQIPALKEKILNWEKEKQEEKKSKRKVKDIEKVEKFKEIKINNISVQYKDKYKFFQTQIKRESFENNEKAIFLITILNFYLGNKTIHNEINFAENYNIKGNTGKSGTALGYKGYLHNFIFGQTLLETLHFNTLTEEDIKNSYIFCQGKGIPVWEEMPQNENCEKAKEITETYLGRLVPLNKFILLTETDEIYISDGVIFPTYKEGISDFSTSVSICKEKILYVNTQKKIWRQLISLLSFLKNINEKDDFICMQLKLCLKRALQLNRKVNIWSGGIQITPNNGEQYTAGLDNFIESSVIIERSCLGETWYNIFSNEFLYIEKLKNELGKKIKNYNKDFKSRKSNTFELVFWEKIEKIFPEVMQACYSTNYEEKLTEIHKIYFKIAEKIYNDFCPQNSSKQISIWAKNLPNFKNIK